MSEELEKLENLIEVEPEKKPKGWWNTDKEFDLGVDNNQVYWEEFKKFKWGDNPDKKQILSMRQYKSSIMNFMQFAQKDILTVSKKEIDTFLETIENKSTKLNKQAHIKSLLTFIIQKNIMGAMGRASKNSLLVIIML